VDDASRFLGRAAGYVRSSAIAIDKLEVIRPEEQAEQTRRARVEWTKAQQRRWGEAAKAIASAVEGFAAGGRVDRRLAGDLRQIRRGAERVTRRFEDDLRRAGGP
jgi:hypothetical protein